MKIERVEVRELALPLMRELHSHTGEKGRTYAQLYEEARAHGLKGRSSMTKAELEKKLNH